jgi:hypothetical protein
LGGAKRPITGRIEAQILPGPCRGKFNEVEYPLGPLLFAGYIAMNGAEKIIHKLREEVLGNFFSGDEQ